jgi:hypothetical protein
MIMPDSTVLAAIIGAIATVAAAVIAILAAKRQPIEPPYPLWRKLPLSPDLEDAIIIAMNQAHRDGKSVMSTRYFFAAILRLNPESLRDVLRLLTMENALPELLAIEDSARHPKLMVDLPFSACVSDSLSALSIAAKNSSPLTISDVFIDIAKNGHGESVARLRQHGFDTVRIDRLVAEYNIPISIERAMQAT